MPSFVPDTNLEDASTSKILKNMIQHEFRSYVKVDHVLSLFTSEMHRTRVLTDDDISSIKARNRTEGDRIGADELLDRLSNYIPNWFTVMQEVLRDPTVGLYGIAKSFDKSFEKAHTERLTQTVSIHRAGADNAILVRADSTSNQVQRQQPTNRANVSNNTVMQDIVNRGTADDFDLDEDQAISEADEDPTLDMCCPDECISDMPKPESSRFLDEFAETKEKEKDEVAKSSIQSRPLPDPNAAAIDVEETMVQPLKAMSLQAPTSPVTTTQKLVSLPAPSNLVPSTQKETPSNEGNTKGDEEGSVISSSHTYESMDPKSSEYDEIESVAGASAACSARREVGFAEKTYDYASSFSSSGYGQRPRVSIPVRKESLDVKRQLISEFSFAETEKALSNFQGWHQKQTDKNVIHTFKEILNRKEDGRYLLWYWEKKKRPAICVSFKGELITFVIHRRRNKFCPSLDSKYVYYIDKSTPKATLEDLFMHHKDNGLLNMKDGSLSGETIKLTHPIAPPSRPRDRT